VQVRWLRRALENLDEQATYIGREDPVAPYRIIEGIATSVEQLATPPASGRPGRVPGTRELVIVGTPVIVPYRIKADTVEILRVFHVARKWPTRV
jgi:plasmid stabilization system protein ParE